jgi:hypothetical protein
MNRTKLFLFAAVLLMVAQPALAETSLWQVTAHTRAFGPVEFHLQIEQDGDVLRGHSLSGSASLLARLADTPDISAGLMAFSAKRGDGGAFTGTVTAPWPDGGITLTRDDDTLAGEIDDGFFAGSLDGVRVAKKIVLRNYPAILADFDDVVAARLFDPDDLQQPAYLEFREQLGQVVDSATDDLDLLFGFRWLWQNDPFSHFQLKRSEQSAAELFRFFDSYRVGFEAATVEFVDDVAILTVRTMMGADTIEQIVAAYEEIAAVNPAALIIDLRGNGGGAFAVKPLVEHVIDEPVDAGYFISQVWNRKHDALPSTEQVLAVTPWGGWSIIGFWAAVQESDIVRVQFNPAQPNFDGPVVVLLDARSASATELAADALRSSGVATLVGKRTAGEMLSQSMFDVRDDFMVSLPVADYYSIAHGRIEGAGVPVDVEAEHDEALAVARELLRKRTSRTD